MKTDKVLLNLSSLENIQEYIKLGVSNFLFPLEGYSIGYETFSLEEIKAAGVKAYLLINRLLTDDDIDEFLKLELPSNIKGLVIEDIGLYYALKDSELELINFQNHLNNNYKTINYWLDRFDSLVLSTDITREEVEEILDKSIKPLVINTLGYPMIMYSRRHLVSNYYRHIKESSKFVIDITEEQSGVNFKLKENVYGTAVFDNNLLDIRDEAIELDDEKIKFYLINTAFLSNKDVISALKGESLENTTKGFLTKKTIYRIGDMK